MYYKIDYLKSKFSDEELNIIDQQADLISDAIEPSLYDEYMTLLLYNVGMRSNRKTRLSTHKLIIQDTLKSIGEINV